MAKTELSQINQSIRTGDQTRLGCGATYIKAGAVYSGDWVAIQSISTTDVVLKISGTAETIVDWEGVIGDLTLESSVGTSPIWYGNFTQIEVDAGIILAYKRC